MKPIQCMFLLTLLQLLRPIISGDTDAVIYLHQLSPEDYHHNWEQTSSRLNNASSLIINTAVHIESNLLKVLLLPLPSLKVLAFNCQRRDMVKPAESPFPISQQSITPDILNVIFNSSYLKQLTTLSLHGTSLTDQLLSNISMTSALNSLQRLDLGGNFIGKKGLKRLSKLITKGISWLDISGSLLRENETVQALIELICGHSQLCRKKLQYFDLSSTSIRAEGFDKLIKSIDTSHMKTFNMSHLRMHQPLRRHQSSNYTPYKSLATLSMPALTTMTLNDLELDKNITILLKNWKLPSLRHLSLVDNFIDDEGLKQWINKDNMPRLSTLILHKNPITSDCMTWLKDQDIPVTAFYAGMSKVDYQGVDVLSQLPQITQLQLSRLDLSIQTLSSLLCTQRAPLVHSITLMDDSNVDEAIMNCSWSKINNLHTLVLSKSELPFSLPLLMNQLPSVLPKLQILYLENVGKDHKDTVQLLSKMSTIFPALRMAKLSQSPYIPVNLTQIQQKGQRWQNNVTISLGFIIYMVSQSQKRNALSLVDLSLLISSSVTDIVDLELDNALLSEPLVSKLVTKLSRLLSLTGLFHLTINNANQLTLLTKWLWSQNVTSLSRLTQIKISKTVPHHSIMALLDQVKMPLLRIIQIKIRLSTEIELRMFKQWLQEHVLIQQLHCHLQFTDQQANIHLSDFYNELELPYLHTIKISGQRVEVKEISGLIHRHSTSLRQLHLAGNFLEHRFISTLASHNVLLTHLDLGGISISRQELASLATLQTGFIHTLLLPRCQIPSSSLIHMIEVINRSYFMPKLSMLNFNHNDIRQEALSTLLNQGLHELKSFRIAQSINPNIINLLLSYSTSIWELVTQQVPVYTFKEDQIVPHSLRRVETISIDTVNWRTEDFAMLAGLDLGRVQWVRLYMQQLYECQVLYHLIKAISGARKVWLKISNNRHGLSSQCLTSNDNVKSRLQQFTLIDEFGTTSLPFFVKTALNSVRQLTLVVLSDCRLPLSALNNLASQNQLEYLYIRFSFLTDSVLSQVLERSRRNLRYLLLSDVDNTIESLEKLKNSIFPELHVLGLSGMPLGQQVLGIVSSINAPKLESLFLARCNINQIKDLSSFASGHLKIIDLSFNKLSARDLTMFLQGFNKKNLPELSMVQAQGILMSPYEYKLVKQAADSKGLTLKVDRPHYMNLINNAQL